MSIEAQWKSHVGKVSVRLELVGFDLQPDQLTTAFGLEPTLSDYTHVPAQFTPGGLLGGRGFGKWCYDTAAHLHSHDVNEHLRHLLGIFRPLRSQIDELRPRPALVVCVHYESTIAGTGAAPLIDADCIAGLAELGASLVVQVFKIDDADAS
jgi:hypothetical protein